MRLPTARQAAGRALTFLLPGCRPFVGPHGADFHYSDTWQLVINTGTTIITFLMVFLIQNSQNRDSAAIQVKLDELIRVARPNSFVGIEPQLLKSRGAFAVSEAGAMALAATRGGGHGSLGRFRFMDIFGCPHRVEHRLLPRGR